MTDLVFVSNAVSGDAVMILYAAMRVAEMTEPGPSR